VRYIPLTHPTGSAIALVSLRKKKYNETIKTTFSLFGGKNMSEEKSWANVAKFVGLCAAFYATDTTTAATKQKIQTLNSVNQFET
jgi:hypothetical protein